MSDMPLYEQICLHLQREAARFHTPGHAGRAQALRLFGDYLRFDLTEVEGLDALYEASGALLESEQKAARFFRARRTLYSAGGATLCIQTMLGLAAKRGGKVVFARNMHRSAIHACALLDIQPVFLMAGTDGRIMPADLERLLCAQSADAVYITSPDYYGRLQDVAGISSVCKKAGIPLLVDNAHGTHLMFFGLHPLQLGADMTACSAHKTLPVLTGGAYLNIMDSDLAGQAKPMMAVFGSTSPSYPVLLSLEICRDWCEREGAAAFARLHSQVDMLRREAHKQGFSFESTWCDPVRYCLNTGEWGLDGRKAAAVFREYGVEPEYADAGHVVLICTPFHTAEEYDRVRRATQALRPDGYGVPLIAWPQPEIALPLREAMFARQEEVPVQAAAGRVAAQAICPCPPGVPLVIPGEKIDADLFEVLLKSGILSVKVVK